MTMGVFVTSGLPRMMSNNGQQWWFKELRFENEMNCNEIIHWSSKTTCNYRYKAFRFLRSWDCHWQTPPRLHGKTTQKPGVAPQLPWEYHQGQKIWAAYPEINDCFRTSIWWMDLGRTLSFVTPWEPVLGTTKINKTCFSETRGPTARSLH